jgi:hypothetical protein
MNFIVIIICSIILPILSLKQTKPKLCVNCKYFIPDNDNGKYAKCSLFQKEDGLINYLVNGINENEYYFCSTLRSNKEYCGKEGTKYKRKYIKNKNLKN